MAYAQMVRGDQDEGLVQAVTSTWHASSSWRRNPQSVLLAIGGAMLGLSEQRRTAT
jgi:hypothetical protein